MPYCNWACPVLCGGAQPCASLPQSQDLGRRFCPRPRRRVRRRGFRYRSPNDNVTLTADSGMKSGPMPKASKKVTTIKRTTVRTVAPAPAPAPAATATVTTVRPGLGFVAVPATQRYAPAGMTSPYRGTGFYHDRGALGFTGTPAYTYDPSPLGFLAAPIWSWNWFGASAHVGVGGASVGFTANPYPAGDWYGSMGYYDGTFMTTAPQPSVGFAPATAVRTMKIKKTKIRHAPAAMKGDKEMKPDMSAPK